MTDHHHVYELFDPTLYVSNWELDGKDHIVTIHHIEAGEVVGEDGKKARKPLVFFTNWPKPLILGRRMAAQLIKLFREPDWKKWNGRSFTIYPVTEKCFGEMMDVVRIRPKLPPQQVAQTNPERPLLSIPDRIAAVKTALRGAVSLGDIDVVRKKAAPLLVELNGTSEGDDMELAFEAKRAELEEQSA